MDLSSDVLEGVSLELEKHLLGLLEILPRSLRADVHSAHWVSGPTVVVGVIMVVRVHVIALLQSVLALSVEPVGGLESLGN